MGNTSQEQHGERERGDKTQVKAWQIYAVWGLAEYGRNASLYPKHVMESLDVLKQSGMTRLAFWKAPSGHSVCHKRLQGLGLHSPIRGRL